MPCGGIDFTYNRKVSLYPCAHSTHKVCNRGESGINELLAGNAAASPSKACANNGGFLLITKFFLDL